MIEILSIQKIRNVKLFKKNNKKQPSWSQARKYQPHNEVPDVTDAEDVKDKCEMKHPEVQSQEWDDIHQHNDFDF